jgi:ribonuclease P protein component
MANDSAPFAFPRSSRVRKRREYLAIQRGPRVKTRHFVLLLARGKTKDAPTRLGIVASKQVGNAVHRNRAKRLVREAFRTRKSLFPPGLDIVVIVLPGAPDLSLADVVDEWTRAAPHIRRKSGGLTPCLRALASSRSTRPHPRSGPLPTDMHFALCALHSAFTAPLRLSERGRIDAPSIPWRRPRPRSTVAASWWRASFLP